MLKDFEKIKTLGELKAAGYSIKPVKDEMRHNLIEAIRNGKNCFDGIIGYKDSVIPDLESAILARHNIILLGLRGQAKTRIARLMTNLLDEYIPIVKDSEINDNPLDPISKYAKDKLLLEKDETEIEWVSREERYTEKLATPDVTIADLIGDVDPIKAAALKLHYNDERVIHFGLIPRSHRGIFVINELPDLQPRIQVALFNILQEKDIQIRGFKIRLPLDVQFVFTANPEDYTNRGSIVTPLKDRIDSQILTHYPNTIELSKKITEQEAKLTSEQRENISIPDVIKNLIEEISFEARESEYVDEKSGVSARLTISAYENLVSTIERRMLKCDENKGSARIIDFIGIIPAITGKVELVYEGEQEGPKTVAKILIGKAIKKQFETFFPNPEKLKKEGKQNPYAKVVQSISKNKIVMLSDLGEVKYKEILYSIDGLAEVVEEFHPDKSAEIKILLMELLLHGLAEFSLVSKEYLNEGVTFADMLSSMFSFSGESDGYNKDFELDDESDLY